jgi:hypothetical protein
VNIANIAITWNNIFFITERICVVEESLLM